jgi:hypothetical protein
MIASHYPPRFSVQIYLICLSVIMLISFISFLLLWKTHKKEKNRMETELKLTGEHVESALLSLKVADELNVQIEDETVDKFSTRTIVYLLIILWTSILLIGCIPSINSYSLNPYGASTFHYVLILCK